MKKVIISVSALAFILLAGVASASNDNGFPGLINKLDEIKTEIISLSLSVPEPLDVNVLNQATSTPSFPTEMNVTVLNPVTDVTIQEPLDVNVVSGASEDNYGIGIFFDNVTGLSGTVYSNVIDVGGYSKIHIFSKGSGSGGSGSAIVESSVDGLEWGSFDGSIGWNTIVNLNTDNVRAKYYRLKINSASVNRTYYAKAYLEK
jgi:hypothetical protein